MPESTGTHSARLSRRSFVAALGTGALVPALAAGLTACDNAQDNTTDAIPATTPVSEIKNTHPVVFCRTKLNTGEMRGFTHNGVDIYLGIQYGTAERFKNPEPMPESTSVQRCYIWGPVAPQPATFADAGTPNAYGFLTPTGGRCADMVGNEQCLYLNIWAPTGAAEAEEPLPVFFFVHGGGLTSGASSELAGYDGEAFAKRENVIFVSVNHRLGYLGFTDLSECGDEYADSAIVGINDLKLALQWVQENIAKFGGDPENVTICGQSGGGTKVECLACMTDTDDLFSKVFVMSGTSGAFADDKQSGLDSTARIKSRTGREGAELAEYLESLSYEELYQVMRGDGGWSVCCYGNGTYEQPIVDEAGNVNPHAAKRTWMVTTTFGEMDANMGIIMNEGYLSLSALDEEELASRLANLYGDGASEVAARFAETYPDLPAETLPFINVSQNSISRSDLIAEGGRFDQLTAAGATVYSGVVTYLLPVFGGITMHHSGDIPFWFGNIDKTDWLVAGDEQNAWAASHAMMDALGTFCHTGNPSTSENPWEAWDPGTRASMELTTKSRCVSELDSALYEAITAHISE